MPRFYFDVRAGQLFTPDEEGLEFDSQAAAEREAACAAAEIGRDLLPLEGPCEIIVEVKDEQRRPAFTVKVAVAIERAGPGQEPGS